MSGSDQSFSIFVSVLFALLVFHWVTDPSTESTEKTYWIDREGKAQYSQEFSADRSSGTVTVALRIAGAPRAVYAVHNNCRVVTTRDWSCESGLESTDGKITDDISESDPRIRSVSVYRWWLARAFGGLAKPTTAK
jgi:hypothetical protein